MDLTGAAMAAGWVARLAGAGCSAVALDPEALEGEGRPGAVAEQALSAGGGGAKDADGSIQAEAAGGLPGEHVGDRVASWKVTVPSSSSEKRPSRTTTWKWKAWRSAGYQGDGRPVPGSNALNVITPAPGIEPLSDPPSLTTTGGNSTSSSPAVVYLTP